jgi:hypothetical protein
VDTNEDDDDNDDEYYGCAGNACIAQLWQKRVEEIKHEQWNWYRCMVSTKEAMTKKHGHSLKIDQRQNKTA